MRVITALCVSAVACATFAACGSSSSSTDTKDQISAATDGTLPCDVTTPVAELAGYPVPKASEPYDIALLQVTKTGYYFQALAYGAETAAEEAGVNLKVYAGQGFYSPANQLQQAEQAIREGVDAIVLQPADYAGSAAVVQAANEADVPIINIATEVKDPDVAKVVQDDYAWGALLADKVAEAAGAGEGILMAGPATATWAVKRAEGFADRIAEEYPDLDLVAAPNTDLDPARGLEAFENTAKTTTDLAWVASVYEMILPAASLPPQYRGKVPYVAGSYEPSVIEGLKDGSITSAISTEPIGVARVGIADIVTRLNGSQTPNLHCIEPAVFTAADIDTELAQSELLPATEQ